MIRDVQALTRETYDLVIVGGGVYGICVAREAALNGLRVCLIERDDFCAATSSHSLRIIHGGLRYLQHLHLRRMRESIRERSTMIHLAPHLVRPLPFVIPTYGHGLRGREVMAVALRMNEWISADRNRDLPDDRRIPAGRTVSRAECKRLLPGIPEKGLTGGAIWYDGQVRDSERLALELLAAAVEAGACVANYTEATRLIERDGRVVGVGARDVRGGRDLEIAARVVLNAAGPWSDRILAGIESIRSGPLFHHSIGMNLVTRQLMSGHAAAIPFVSGYSDREAVLNKGVRHFFIVPWDRYSLIGTRHLPHVGSKDSFAVDDRDVDRFVAEVNAAYPPARLGRDEVHRVFAGMLPALDTKSAEVQLDKQFRLVDHGEVDGIEGLVSVVGVKWTTARDVAARSMAPVLSKLGREEPTRDTSRVLPPGSRYESFGALVAEAMGERSPDLREESVRHLLETYGAGYREVLRIADAEPAYRDPVCEETPVIRAEVVHAVRSEMAQCLADVVLCRTRLGWGGNPGERTLLDCARIMGRELDWSPERIRDEVDDTVRALEPGYPSPTRNAPEPVVEEETVGG